MEILVVIIGVAAAGVAWWGVDRWRSTRHRIDPSSDARAARKATKARKELIRRFPDRDPESRQPITKRVRDLTEGEMVKVVGTDPASMAILGPSSSEIDQTTAEFAVFTGFVEAGRRQLVGVCDVDGYGTRSIDVPLDSHIVAYVETH